MGGGPGVQGDPVGRDVSGACGPREYVALGGQWPSWACNPSEWVDVVGVWPSWPLFAHAVCRKCSLVLVGMWALWASGPCGQVTLVGKVVMAG